MISAINFSKAGVALVNASLPIILYYLRWVLHELLSIFSGLLPILSTPFGIGISLLVTISGFLLRKYIRGAQCKLANRVDDKTVLITGANSGIGFSLMKLLALRGANVHILCRSQKRGEEAIQKLKKACVKTDKITLHIGDLSDLISIKRFAEKFKIDHPCLDVLVCNAGLLGQVSFTLTKDGHELTYQTNYLAHYLLMSELLPLIPKSGRVVNVSSMMHLFGDTTDYTILNSPNHYGSTGLQAYNRTKLAQVMLSKELSLWMPSGPTVVSCHPGNVHSNILQTGVLSFLEQTWVRYLIFFVLKTEDDGAQTPLHACLATDLVPGGYYRECRLDENVNPLVNNNAERKKLIYQSRKALSLSFESVS